MYLGDNGYAACSTSTGQNCTETPPNYALSKNSPMLHGLLCCAFRWDEMWWIFCATDGFVCKTYKILRNYFMILGSHWLQESLNHLQFSLTSSCLSALQKHWYIAPSSRNASCSYYVLQAAPHCSFKLLSLGRFLNMLFTFTFLLPILELFSTWLSPLLSMKSHSIRLVKSFSRQN